MDEMIKAQHLADIHEQCFDQGPRPWTAKEMAEFLRDPTVFLAELPDAFAMLRVAGGEAELLTIAVLPASRRQGKARQLLDACLAEASERSVSRILLEVADDNAAAQALYEAAGFTSAGYRKDYYRSGGRRSSAIVLEKTLLPTAK